MRMNKCFTTVFDAPLKERGFKRKGILYYRMNGDILQGITILLTNPYELTFSYIPYWAYGTDDRYKYSLSSSHWAEQQYVIGSCYSATDEETEIEKMQKLAKIFVEVIIPYLDGIYDLDTYISAESVDSSPPTTESFVTEEEKKWFGSRYASITRDPRFNQYAMLLKAYRDGSFSSAEMLVNNTIQKNYLSARKYGPYSTTVGTLISYSFKDFYKCYLNEDLNWIVPIYEEKCAEMKQRLREELKLEVE